MYKNAQKTSWLIGLAASLSLPVHAQTDAAQTDSPQIDEIQVTASKRPQTQDEFVGAISLVRQPQGAQLRLADIAQQVPGFSVIQQGARNPSELVIRGMRLEGVGANDLGGDGSSVVSYLDNSPLQGYFIPPNINLKDMEQIEVLRGPQGTLFGHTSIGGLVRYSTAKPDLAKASGRVSTALSQTHASSGINHDTYLVVNQPLVSDELGARIVLGREQNQGFIDNDYLLDGPRKDINDDDAQLARLSLAWQPSDALSFGLSHHYQKNHADDRQSTNKAFTGQDYAASSRYLQPMTNELNLTSLDASYDMGWASLSASASRYDYDYRSRADQTDYFYALDELYYENSFYSLYDELSAFTANDFRVEKDSLEVRMVSDSDQRLRWLTGIFYTTDDLQGQSADFLPGFPEAVDLDRPDELDYMGTQDQSLRETSMYAELAYDLTSAWELSLGLRHFRLKDELESCFAYPIGYWIEGDDIPFDCVGGKDSHKDNLAKVSSRYQINDNHSLYVTVAEGFRRGGANALPQDAVAPRGYLPDQVVNYELGGHSYWLDRQLRLSAAIFYIDWKDIQVYGVADGRHAITLNAGRARSQGVELEALFQLSPALNLRASYSLTQAELRKDIAAIDGTHDVFAGDRLPGSPRDQWHLALEYERALGNALLDASLSVARVGNITTHLNDGFYDYSRLPGYTLANARLGVSWRNWHTGAFVNNIGNTRAVTARRSDFWYGEQGQFETITRPRTLGVFVSYTY